jgi:hypothetical protein
MRVLAPIRHTEQPEVEQYLFFCPGCQCGHAVTVSAPPEWGGGRARWTFDRNMEAPTFGPSVLHPGVKPAGEWRGQPRCHLYVKAGQLEFLGDCEHALAGKTVPMVDLEAPLPANEDDVLTDVVLRGPRRS